LVAAKHISFQKGIARSKRLGSTDLTCINLLRSKTNFFSKLKKNKTFSFLPGYSKSNQIIQNFKTYKS
jgi:hypothetical protein